MYELIQLGPRSYYIQSPANIGLYRLDESRVCLFDGGSDKDAGRKVRQILQANGWQLTAIYNTHSNADHIGGNRYLQGQTGCKIYAPGIECAFTQYPILEPSFLFGGYPCKELRHKFLLAQPSDAAPLTAEVLPEGVQMLPLPGHFFDMVGFRTPDGVVYLADCLSSHETLEKYQIGFVYDVAAYLETLEQVKTMQASMFVPAHAAPTADIVPLAQENIDKVHHIAATILELLAQPMCFEVLLQQLCNRYGLQLNLQQYALLGSTVRSYLAWLKDTGRLQAECRENLLVWQRV